MREELRRWRRLRVTRRRRRSKGLSLRSNHAYAGCAARYTIGCVLGSSRCAIPCFILYAVGRSWEVAALAMILRMRRSSTSSPTRSDGLQWRHRRQRITTEGACMRAQEARGSGAWAGPSIQSAVQIRQRPQMSTITSPPSSAYAPRGLPYWRRPRTRSRTRRRCVS